MFEIVKEAKIEEPDVKCGGCNWAASHQYVLAETEKEAKDLYNKGEAGLCGDCMCGMIVEAGYIVNMAPKRDQAEKDPEKRSVNAARKLRKKLM